MVELSCLTCGRRQCRLMLMSEIVGGFSSKLFFFYSCVSCARHFHCLSACDNERVRYRRQPRVINFFFSFFLSKRCFFSYSIFNLRTTDSPINCCLFLPDHRSLIDKFSTKHDRDALKTARVNLSRYGDSRRVSTEVDGGVVYGKKNFDGEKFPNCFFFT